MDFCGWLLRMLPMTIYRKAVRAGPGDYEEETHNEATQPDRGIVVQMQTSPVIPKALWQVSIHGVL